MESGGPVLMQAHVAKLVQGKLGAAYRPARARRPGIARGTAGFTLLELLVAISVMAVLAVLSWRGLDGMTSAQRRIDEQSAVIRGLETGLVQWRADWDALTERPGITSLDWNGNTLRLLRPTQGSNPSGLVVVAWTVRGTGPGAQWLRWQSPVFQSKADFGTAWLRAAQWANYASEEEARHAVSILPMAGWELFYYRGNAWSNPLSSADEQGAYVSSIPDGVRLIVELPSNQTLTGKLTHDWVRASAGGRKS